MSFLKNRTVLGVICIVLSLLICFVVAPLLTPVSPKKRTLSVSSGYQSRRSDHQEMLKIVEVGSYNLPKM